MATTLNLPDGGTVVVYDRADWGARAPRSTPTLLSDSQRFICHHTTGRTLGHSDLARWTRNIQNYHMDQQRWQDIGYNFLIGWNDREDVVEVYEGRGWGVAGAHARGYNSSSHGIALMGDGGRLPPEPVLDAFAVLLWEHDAEYGRRIVQGHRDVGSTACPGEALYNYLPILRQRKRPIGAGTSALLVTQVASPGRGYWQLDRAGGVFAFGGARYAGSLPELRDEGVITSNTQAVDMVSVADDGYLILDAQGGVFAFGSAKYEGNAHQVEGKPVSIEASPDGYWVMTDHGIIKPFGSAEFLGGVKYREG